MSAQVGIPLSEGQQVALSYCYGYTIIGKCPPPSKSIIVQLAGDDRMFTISDGGLFSRYKAKPT